jgi:hypothetical protein
VSQRPVRSRWLRFYTSRRRRLLIASAAALPLFQATGCFPDPIGAVNFELQTLINNALIGGINVIVQNLLGM